MILAVVNNKGGVGKTTCTVNLAHALVNRGKRVLVIDNDPQTNASTLLLGNDTPEHTLYHVQLGEIEASKVIYTTQYGVDVLPNSQATANIETELIEMPGKGYTILRDRVRDTVKDLYDVVLIDCPPTLGLWVVQALMASDAVIVPVEAGSRFSLDGLTAVYEAVEQVAAKHNPQLKFLRAVINKVDLRISASKVLMEHLRKRFPDRTFETTIPTNSPIQAAEIKRSTVIRHDPHCNASKRFRQLADELLEIIGHDQD